MRSEITRLFLLGIGLVLSSTAIAALPSQPLTRPALETTPAVEWDEGLPVNAQNRPEAAPNGSAATAAGTTLYRTFSGTRFQPTAAGLTYEPIGGAVYATALPAGGFSFSLDFDLPAGATITEVVFYVVDNNAANIGVSLRSYNPQTDVFTILESGTSTGASTALQTIVLAVEPAIQVDNATTTYRLRVAPGVASSSHLLRGARIGYTVPIVYLPVLEK